MHTNIGYVSMTVIMPLFSSILYLKAPFNDK